ncbi:unknown [Clostridium sp. CAG:389]|nr:unknown [Clostridium sp. CAG:389]
MKKFSTYLLVVFMMLFWVLRIVITLASQLGKSFMGIVPMNETFEIAILFLTLLCVVLIVKRKMIGSLLYLTIHAIYFGGDVTNKLNILARNETLTLAQSTEFMFSMIGIILPLAVLLDLLLDKNRKMNPKDEKTDWFYKNEQFDRKLDDRADKNNYRTL